MSGIPFDLDTAALAGRMRSQNSDLELRKVALDAIKARKAGNGAALDDMSPQPEKATDEAPTGDQGRMIFLRPNKTEGGWIVQFYGIADLANAAQTIPAELGGKTLRDVLGFLSETYKGQLGGAWLLVAP